MIVSKEDDITLINDEYNNSFEISCSINLFGNFYRFWFDILLKQFIFSFYSVCINKIEISREVCSEHGNRKMETPVLSHVGEYMYK